MKVNVIKTFLSGRYEGEKGDTLDLPDSVADYLAEIGLVAPVQPEEESQEETQEEPQEEPKKRTKRGSK